MSSLKSKTSDSDTNRFLQIRDHLNQVSPSFCLAKWMQVTLHLHNGTNHSCHHPTVHPIPLEELEANPAALHNTPFKKDQQRLMKNGVRPAECDYCWTVEDLGPDQVSDRYMKSSTRWAAPFFEQVRKLPDRADILPSSVEVSFSRNCNFKCSYCSPSASTRWAQEIKQFGPHPYGPQEALDDPYREARTDESAPFKEDRNPYLRAFWKWWPELKANLRVFRITGGEPLLSPSTFRVMEELRDEPNPDLRFAVNTNLGVPDAQVDRFIEQGRWLTEGKKVASFTVYTSLEAWGARAEYIRHGLELGRFWSNVEKLLESIPDVELVFMCTYNALSVTSFTAFLERVADLKRKRPGRSAGTLVDISYLRQPEHQAANILNEDFFRMADDSLKFMNESGFSNWEIPKMRRICEWLRQPLSPGILAERRARFRAFFSEHDRRRGTDFLATFPEYAEFWARAGDSR